MPCWQINHLAEVFEDGQVVARGMPVVLPHRGAPGVFEVWVNP